MNTPIVEALEAELSAVAGTHQPFVEDDLEATLERKPNQRIYAHRLNEETEAHLIRLARSQAPRGGGGGRWRCRRTA